MIQQCKEKSINHLSKIRNGVWDTAQLVGTQLVSKEPWVQPNLGCTE